MRDRYGTKLTPGDCVLWQEPDGSSLLAVVVEIRGKRARVLGNVAHASHGFTRAETLGGGDTKVTNQVFNVALPEQTPVEVRVHVDGRPWREVPTLDNASSSDRVYTLDRETGALRFGDGRHGRRPPSGQGNIVASYRYGGGSAGQPANALTLVDVPGRELTKVRLPKSPKTTPCDPSTARP